VCGGRGGSERSVAVSLREDGEGGRGRRRGERRRRRRIYSYSNDTIEVA